MKKINIKKLSACIYAAVIVLLAFLFFTNDFGLVDIRKTAVITGAGIDIVEGGVEVTAQLAVPQPAEDGQTTKYLEVTGGGATVSDALNDINVKTGFYPKLVFCKLILLGESCARRNIIELLNYFFRDDYTHLTPQIAMCAGSAGDMVSSRPAFGSTSTEAIERLLSHEAQKSGNVAGVRLKDIGIQTNSRSRACYMPYIVGESGVAEEEGNASPADRTDGGSPQESGQSGSGQGKDGAAGEKELVCNRAALFRGGIFAGVLSPEDTFALNALSDNIGQATLSCDVEERIYSLNLRSCSGGADLRLEDGPRVALAFSALAQITDATGPSSPEADGDGVVHGPVLRGGEDRLKEMFTRLYGELVRLDCDALGVADMLYRGYRDRFDSFGEDVFKNARVECSVSLRSSG